jgi:glyoxylase-like metal-dependent hydrolase (beta-lactamase superfamily II)
VNYAWEMLADRVGRCRLRFLDVTVGVVWGRAGAVLIDAGSTLTESRAIRSDVQEMAGREVSHIVLTHHHFDHVLGASAFDGAAVYCAPEAASTMADRAEHLRADAIGHGADPHDVEEAVAALRRPQHEVRSAVIDLGDRVVSVSHPGRGHTDHDLIAAVRGADRRVVFCGDLVEESNDPYIDGESDTAAWPDTLDRLLELGGDDGLYVPGHGATVDAGFVRRQRWWIAGKVTNSKPHL